MGIVRWDPFRELNFIKDEMGRIFEHTLGRQNMMMPVWGISPRIEVYQTDNEVIVSAEIPGIETKDDIQVTVSDNTLTLKGEIKKSEEKRDENFVHSERYYGSFHRVVSLPAKVNPDQADASYKNGILEIHLIKEAPEKQKKVDLNFN